MGTRIHPLTKETIPWQWLRFKGCNTAIASENLMTFRSGSASFVDLAKGQGTSNLGEEGPKTSDSKAQKTKTKNEQKYNQIDTEKNEGKEHRGRKIHRKRHPN